MSAAPSLPATGAAGFASGDQALALPRALGRLVLLKLIARGGMGDVYLAGTTGIEGAERACVVKTVRRDHIHDGSFLARFLDEARVQSQLNHPGVAQVLEASTDANGEPYTVVEHVEGRSLSDVRARSIQLGVRIGWPEAVAIAIEMANALAHVHERAGTDGTPLGIVHRDLSPQNVMVGYVGEVKLIDFGTARGHNRRCHTVAGVVFAKPGYVAPEVARQQVGDGRIDLYALGIMLWEMCAGRRFLTGDPQKHLEEAAAGQVKVPLLSDLVEAPKSLDDCIQNLTKNDPDERTASASIAAQELARVLAAAEPGKNGERSMRGRVAALMRTLWPHEPQRSRSEFARLLKDSRGLRKEEDEKTPASAPVIEAAASRMNDEAILPGTPYRLLSKIGEGASGVVWEGEHVELGRRLAIKVLAQGHGSAKDAVERFRREARAVAKLSHPNLVQIADFGRSVDGRVFLAMELLKGKTLDEHLDRAGGMDWREAVRLAIDVTHALSAAHEAGLVHRDLKPANLFLTEDGTLKLLDFGVAMALADVTSDAEEKRQKGFAIFGTPEYMAPEQVAGEAVDARCDLYALGCVLYELVTGSEPFDGPSNVVVMGKQLRESPEAPRFRAPQRAIPAEVEAIVMKLLAKKPDDRFASADSLRAALEEALRSPMKRRNHVRRVAGAFVGAAMALSIVAGGISWRAMHGSRVASSSDEPIAMQSAAPAPTVDPTPPAPPATGTAAIAPMETPPVAMAIEPSEKKIDAKPARKIEAKRETKPAKSVEAKVADAKPALPAETLPAADEQPSEAPAIDAKVAEEKPADVVAADDSHASEPAAADATPPLPSPAPETHRAEPVSHKTPAAAPADDHATLADARANAKGHSNDARALKAWALAAMRAGAYREARRAADAWALHDSSAEPRLVLAKVLEASGHRRDARAVLEEWLETHPSSSEAKKLRARLGEQAPRAERTHFAHDR